MDKNNYNEKIIKFPSSEEGNEGAKQSLQGKVLLKCLGYVLVVSFFVFIIFLINSDSTFDSTNQVNEEIINLSVSNNFDFAPYKDGYILAKDGLISAFNTNQELQWEVSGSKTTPTIKTNGDFCLAYYNDDSIAILTNGDKTKKIKTTGDIEYGYVNKRGYTVLFISEVGLKNKIAVYDKYGTMLYFMDNPDKYISYAVLSDDNRTLVTTELSPKKQTFSTIIHIIDIRTNKEKSKIVFEDSVSGGTYFKNKKEFITVFPEKMLCHNTSGKKRWTVDFGGKQLSKIAYNNKNIFALSFNVNSESGLTSEVLFYNASGKHLGSYNAESKVNSVSVFESTALVELDRKICMVNTKGKLLSAVDTNYDIKETVFLRTKKCAFVLSSTLVGRLVPLK